MAISDLLTCTPTCVGASRFNYVMQKERCSSYESGITDGRSGTLAFCLSFHYSDLKKKNKKLHYSEPNSINIYLTLKTIK